MSSNGTNQSALASYRPQVRTSRFDNHANNGNPMGVNNMQSMPNGYRPTQQVNAGTGMNYNPYPNQGSGFGQYPQNAQQGGGGGYQQQKMPNGIYGQQSPYLGRYTPPTMQNNGSGTGVPQWNNQGGYAYNTPNAYGSNGINYQMQAMQSQRPYMPQNMGGGQGQYGNFGDTPNNRQRLMETYQQQMGGYGQKQPMQGGSGGWQSSGGQPKPVSKDPPYPEQQFWNRQPQMGGGPQAQKMPWEGGGGHRGFSSALQEQPYIPGTDPSVRGLFGG